MSLTREEAEALVARYTTRCSKISNAPRGWDYLAVDVLLDGERVGGYTRNYPSFYETFLPFVHDDAVYALYAPHYTGTRILRLSDGQDIGGEEPNPHGFCPTG